MVTSIISLTALLKTCQGNGAKAVDGADRRSLPLKKGEGVERKVNRFPAPPRSGQVLISLLLPLSLKVRTLVLGVDESGLAAVLCPAIMLLIMKQIYVAGRVISCTTICEDIAMESAAAGLTDSSDLDYHLLIKTLHAD